MEDALLTKALTFTKLLDDDGYLLPPSHPNVSALTETIKSTLFFQSTGIQLSTQERMKLKLRLIAFDYYNTVIAEHANSAESDSEE